MFIIITKKHKNNILKKVHNGGIIVPIKAPATWQYRSGNSFYFIYLFVFI